MIRRSSSLALTLAVVLSLSMAARPVCGQSVWVPSEGPRVVTLEFLRPNLEGIDSDFFSPAVFVSTRLGLSSHFALVGELPYSRHKSTQIGTDINGYEIAYTQSSSTLGNAYVGLEWSPGSSPFFGDVGVRLPFTSEDEIWAQRTGLYADINRWEAFLPNTVSIQTAFNLRETSSSNFGYRMRFSPTVWIPTRNSYADVELSALYHWQVGYFGRFVRLGTGVSGRVLLTQRYYNLGQRSLNQFELHTDFGSWDIRPGFELHLPLDSWAATVPVVLGASLSWSPEE